MNSYHFEPVSPLFVFKETVSTTELIHKILEKTREDLHPFNIQRRIVTDKATKKKYFCYRCQILNKKLKSSWSFSGITVTQDEQNVITIAGKNFQYIFLPEMIEHIYRNFPKV